MERVGALIETLQVRNLRLDVLGGTAPETIENVRVELAFNYHILRFLTFRKISVSRRIIFSTNTSTLSKRVPLVMLV